MTIGKILKRTALAALFLISFLIVVKDCENKLNEMHIKIEIGK